MAFDDKNLSKEDIGVCLQYDLCMMFEIIRITMIIYKTLYALISLINKIFQERISFMKWFVFSWRCDYRKQELLINDYLILFMSQIQFLFVLFHILEYFSWCKIAWSNLHFLYSLTCNLGNLSKHYYCTLLFTFDKKTFTPMKQRSWKSIQGWI